MMRTQTSIAFLVLLAPVCGCGDRAAENEKPKPVTEGYRLVYGVQWAEVEPSEQNKTQLTEAILQRLSALSVHSNVKMIDERSVEVKVAVHDEPSLELIRSVLPRRGQLNLNVVANLSDHYFAFKSAQEKVNRDREFVFESKPDGTKQESAVARWVKVGRLKKRVDNKFPLRAQFSDAAIRDAKTKEWINNIPRNLNSATAFDRWLGEQGHEDIEVLVMLDKELELSNAHVASATVSADQLGNPAIFFEMTEEGGIRLGNLTAENQQSQLAILIDGEVISAPTIRSTISSRGEITGQFTEMEVKELAALIAPPALPAPLAQKPMSEGTFGNDENEQRR